MCVSLVFYLRSYFRTQKTELKGYIEFFAPLPNVVTLNLFLLSNNLAFFDWLIEHHGMDLTWGIGCESPCSITESCRSSVIGSLSEVNRLNPYRKNRNPHKAAYCSFCLRWLSV